MKIVLDLIRLFLIHLCNSRYRKFVDLGSGSGSVVFPGILCRNFDFLGVDLDASIVERATTIAQSLSMNRAKFVQQSVLEVDLSQGDIFYIYSPFKDEELMMHMAKRLDDEAKRRSIKIVAGFPPFRSILNEMDNICLEFETSKRGFYKSFNAAS